MHITPSNKTNQQPVKLQFPELSSSSSLLNRSLLKAFVVQKLENSLYKVLIDRKPLTLRATTELIRGEQLTLVPSKPKQDKIHLQLKQRNFQLNSNLSNDVSFPDIFSVRDLLQQNPLFSKDSTVDSIVRTLQYLFPGVEWQPDSKTYYWQFADRQAQAFFNHRSDKKSFLLEYHSGDLGSVHTSLFWQQSDLADLQIVVFFNQFQSYKAAIGNREALRQMAKEIGIHSEKISLGFSQQDKTLQRMQNRLWTV